MNPYAATVTPNKASKRFSYPRLVLYSVMLCLLTVFAAAKAVTFTEYDLQFTLKHSDNVEVNRVWTKLLNLIT